MWESLPIGQQPSQLLQSRVEVEKGALVRVIGPARVQVLDGCIRILGISICKGEAIVINKYRSYCLISLENAVLNVSLGEGGSIERPSPGEEVIAEWESVAKAIVSSVDTVVVVLGAVESGKTSFSTLLSNIALEIGRKPCIIDADVGQGDLAPPTFIGMKCLDRKILWLREEKGDYIKFIGFLTPSISIAMTKIITGVVEFVNKAKIMGRDFIIINTDGWFGDISSIEYKYSLIKSVTPSSIVILGGEFCSPFRSMFKKSSVNVYCLPKPRVIRERSREDRRDLRKINYRKWFSDMKKMCIDLDNISIAGVCAFSGATVSRDEIAELEKFLGTKVILASKYIDADVVVVPDEAQVPREVLERFGHKLLIVKPSNVKGVISAILDKDLNEVGVAIIDEINFNIRKICIQTSYPGEISGLIIGRVKLDEQWNDSIRYPRCVI
jgi:polynucleotide 5'-hydroxyl-kinase GRC3/NOL9